MKRTELTLLTDTDFVFFFERGLRGGLVILVKLYAEENNE